MEWGLRNISSRELTEWQAFFAQEPFGEARGDYRNAILASVFANAFRGRNRQPYKPKDFMPRFWDRQQAEKRDETPAERAKRLLAQVEFLNIAFRGRDLRGKSDGDPS